MRLYREENRAIRSTPYPKYFDNYQCLDAIKFVERDTSLLRELFAQASDTQHANAKALALIIGSITKSREQEVKIFLSEMDDIERTVERKLDADWEVEKYDFKISSRLARDTEKTHSSGEKEAA